MPISSPNPADFETALSELEIIVAAMENGQMPLAAALAAYQRGAHLLRQCQQTLAAAESQLERIESPESPSSTHAGMANAGASDPS